MSSTPRTAGLPGETFSFDASGQLPCDGAQVSWSGGGDPATGTGTVFETRLDSGGRHMIVAACAGRQVHFEVEVPPVDQWLARAREFYGPSVDFAPVRVKASRLVLGPPRTAWACNDVIRFKRPGSPDELPRESTLVHELAHVWQHQRGLPQLLRGFVEQAGRRLGKDPYDYGGPEGARAAGSIDDLSLEAQAQIVTEYWKSRNGHRTDRKGVAFSTPGYVDDLRRLVEGAGIGQRRHSRRSLACTVDTAVALVVNALLARFE